MSRVSFCRFFEDCLGNIQSPLWKPLRSPHPLRELAAFLVPTTSRDGSNSYLAGRPCLSIASSLFAMAAQLTPMLVPPDRLPAARALAVGLRPPELPGDHGG